MNYIVIEMQTNGETSAVISNTFSDHNQAESSYHSILASAAISSVELHAAAILTDNGRLMCSQAYEHRPTTE